MGGRVRKRRAPRGALESDGGVKALLLRMLCSCAARRRTVAEEGRVGSGKNAKQAVWNHSLILHAAGAAGEKKE